MEDARALTIPHTSGLPEESAGQWVSSKQAGESIGGEHLLFTYRAETETRMGPQIKEQHVKHKLHCTYNCL